MKKLCVLTAALAAGLTSFAANAQDRATAASKPGAKVASDKVELASASKLSKPNAVIGEKCPYLFGCGDKDVDKTKTASIGKKAANATKSTDDLFADFDPQTFGYTLDVLPAGSTALTISLS